MQDTGTEEQNSAQGKVDSKNFKESNNFMADVKEHCPDADQKQKLQKLCFIDASSLVDEHETAGISHVSVCASNVNRSEAQTTTFENSNEVSPLELEKNHCFTPENELDTLYDDSLERGDKEPASIQKDLSPSICEMTIEEDVPNNQKKYVGPHTSSKEKDVKVLNLTTEVLNLQNAKGHNDGTREQINLRKELLSKINVILPETPHNSIMALNSVPVEINDTRPSLETVITSFNTNKLSKIPADNDTLLGNNSSPVSSIDNYNSPDFKDKIVYTSDESFTTQQIRTEMPEKKVNAFSRSAWVIDMSGQSATNIKENEHNKLHNNFLLNSSSTECQTKSSIESNVSEKSSQKFFIDLSSIPDPEPCNSKKPDTTKKGNIFSLYIGFDTTNSNKMSNKLVSSLNSRRLGLAKAKQDPEISKSVSAISDEKMYSSAESIIKNHSKHIVPQLASRSNCRDMENLRIKSDLNKESVNNLKHELNIQESPQDGPKTFTISLDADNNCYQYDNSSKFDIQNKGNSTSNSKDTRLIACSKKKPNETNNFNKCPVNSLFTNEALTRECQRRGETKIGKMPCKKQEFVKLSDLGKPTLTSYRQIKEHNIADVRMTRSIPEALKINQKQHITRSIGLFSSSDFLQENASSLKRIFPHLKNDLSRSTGSIGNSLKSSFDIPYKPVENLNGLDTSQESSMQSSLARSNLEVSTTEEMSSQTSVSGNCKQRLGQDLLRMFQEHIGTDVIVEVAGRKMPAHKCILASRFSYNVVHFALCHIYSGTSVIPESISIVELATLADMLGLEGLKEVVMFNLKAKYCHHFHEPCSGCMTGVLECLPLSAAYGLDDIYMKTMRWIRKHYVKIWPTKNFATLPQELRETCYQQKVAHLSAENVVDTVAGCGLILSSLPHGRWTEVVMRTCQRLTNVAAHLTSRHLPRVLETLTSSPPNGPPAVLRALDDCITAAIDWAPVDQVCSSYIFLRTQVLTIECRQEVSHVHSESWELRMVRRWSQLCEISLEKSRQETFHLLIPKSRVRLQQVSDSDSGQETALSPSNLGERKILKSPNLKTDHTKHTQKSIGIARLRQNFVPYATKPTPSSVDSLASNDVWPVTRASANVPLVRMTRAQEQRSKFNKEVANARKGQGPLMPIKVYEDKKKSRHLEQHIKNMDALSSSSSINKEGANKWDTRKALRPAETNTRVMSKTKIPSLVPKPGVKKSATTSAVASADAPRRQALALRTHDANSTHGPPRPLKQTKPSSFMCATASSKAKSIVKTTSIDKPNVKKCGEIKKVERSGTFLKDEPTVSIGVSSP